MEAAVAFAGSALSIAQTTPISDGAAMIGTLGISGFLAWYCYNTTATVIPRMEERNQANLDKQQVQFREELAETRAHYERVIAQILVDHKEAVSKMVESCGRRAV
jgi:hypothetical protein